MACLRRAMPCSERILHHRTSSLAMSFAAPLTALAMQDVVTGSLLDAQDRAQWLLERKRYQEALAVADADSGVPAAMRQQAGPYLHT